VSDTIFSIVPLFRSDLDICQILQYKKTSSAPIAITITAVMRFMYGKNVISKISLLRKYAITREDPITTKVIMVTNIEDVYIHTVVNITQIAPMIHIVS
jgi:hypothetical protein